MSSGRCPKLVVRRIIGGREGVNHDKSRRNSPIGEISTKTLRISPIRSTKES